MPPDPTRTREIEDRLQRRYVDRLSQRVKRLRKLFLERSWAELRVECSHLASTSPTFGFPEISPIASAAEAAIPKTKIPKAIHPENAKAALEILISKLDQIVAEYSIKFGS